MANLLKTKRLIWGFICAVVTIVALLAYASGTRYLAAARAVEHTLAVELAIEGTLSLLKDAETGQRGYVLTGDEVFLEPYEAERSGIAHHFANLTQATRVDPVQTLRLQAIESLAVEKHAFMDDTIRMRRAGDLAGALAVIRSGRGKQIMDQIRVVFRQMAEHEEELLMASKRKASAAQATAAWGIGCGSVLTVLIAFASFVTVHRDVEAMKSAVEELAVSEEHFRLLAEHGSDLVRLLDLRGNANYVSPSIERLLGYGVEEFLALPPLELVHPEDLAPARQFLVDVQNGPRPPPVLTYRLRHKSGGYRFFETHWLARRDASGRVTQLHTTSRDVTDRKGADEQLIALAAELRTLSVRDELTGLYNRRGFSEAAGKSRSLAVRDGRPAALIFVDVNGMKQINDELGHEAGDCALIDAANVLTAAHGQGDVVARLGGDEFVVFSVDFTPRDLEPLRRRLRALADGEGARRGRGYRLSMSAGAAFMEKGSQESLNELLDRADAAMYKQKNARTSNGGITVAPPSRST